MSKIKLAFAPGCEYVERRSVGATGANPQLPLSVAMNKDLFHRRIYLWQTRTAGTWRINGRIVAYLRGQTVFSMPYNIGSVISDQTLQIGVLGVAAPNTIDMVRVQMNGTAQLIIPYNLTLCADTLAIEGVTTFTAGSGIPIDFLGVFSQNYW